MLPIRCVIRPTTGVHRFPENANFLRVSCASAVLSATRRKLFFRPIDWFPAVNFHSIKPPNFQHFSKTRQRCSLKCFDTIDSEELNRRANFMIIETDYVRWRAGYTKNFKEMFERYMNPRGGFISQTKWPPCTWASTYLLNNQRVFWGQRGHVN